MDAHDLAQERAQKLRSALLQEWKRIRLDLANCEKPSLAANELRAHAEVIEAVLQADRDREAEIWKKRDMEIMREHGKD